MNKCSNEFPLDCWPKLRNLGHQRPKEKSLTSVGFEPTSSYKVVPPSSVEVWSLGERCSYFSLIIFSILAFFNFLLFLESTTSMSVFCFYIYVIYRPGGPYPGKNCARAVLSTARGRRPRAVLKTKGTVFPYTDLPRQVNKIFIFSQHLRVCRSILKGCQNARKFHWVRWQETVERM